MHSSFKVHPLRSAHWSSLTCTFSGLLDLYEASGKEEYALWAIQLQSKQDALFLDGAGGGGYFTSAPDPHIVLRMKDAQDGAEPSAASVALANLLRLSHIAEDAHAEYAGKAEGVLRANAPLLEHAPFALGGMVGSAVVRERGYVQMVVVGPPRGRMLEAIRGRFMPQRVVLHLDPRAPPRELAKVNGTLRSLVEEMDKAGGEVRPSVRVCKDFTCGLPIYDVGELDSVLNEGRVGRRNDRSVL